MKLLPPVLLLLSACSTSVKLSWDPVQEADHYLVYENGMLPITEALNSCQIDGLTKGTKYSWHVTAVNESGIESDPSNEVEWIP